MSLDFDSTIAALASAPGAGLRGILRVSGGDVRRVVEQVFEPDDVAHWVQARVPQSHPGTLQLERGTVRLAGRVYLWPTRRSYTGEPMAEIHTIGSPPVLDRLLAELYAAGARGARPGEFTLRAFLNGRVDLVQAEAVLGVIDAESRAELQAALDQLGGGLSSRLGDLRRDLLELLSDLEAGLDFVDEDIEFVSREEVVRRLTQGRQTVDELLQHAEDRLRTTGERQVVLAGLPNAGKSTLLNALTGRDAALTSDIPGTTRDYVAVSTHFGGLPVELIDTAGWEQPAEAIMQQAQEFRARQIGDADLVVWCTAADLPDGKRGLNRMQREACRAVSRNFAEIVTKGDLAGAPAEDVAGRTVVSALTGAHLAGLIDLITGRLADETTGGRQMVGATASRSRESLRQVGAALGAALASAEAGAGDELIAMDVRDALNGLGEILGVVYTDDILDRIFSKFCIGK